MESSLKSEIEPMRYIANQTKVKEKESALLVLRKMMSLSLKVLNSISTNFLSKL